MLTQALAAEVDACIAQFAGERDEHGRRQCLNATRTRSEWPRVSGDPASARHYRAQRHSRLDWHRKSIYLCSSW